MELDAPARAELILCDALEDAADSLPTFCAGRYRSLARALEVESSFAYSAALSCALRRLQAPPKLAKQWAQTLALMSYEERRDHDIGLELAEMLYAAAAQGRVQNADALGYLLRCYFENRRRHLAWRAQAFFEQIRQQLGSEACAYLRRHVLESSPKVALLTPICDGCKRFSS